MSARKIVAIGGSDAGISAALRARELDPTTEVTVVVADAYPNFSICGIPYYVSGEVTHWSNLAHRTAADLAATGMTRAHRHPRHRDRRRRAHASTVTDPDGATRDLDYDALDRRHRRGHRSGRRSPASDRASAPTMACTCCTRWATPSP